ncbi:MAG: hypothetical protein KF861_04465 [Planctomycetaceae bacterium]|nr:hypothetical protein [Planctomycetaceae bacterium]
MPDPQRIRPVLAVLAILGAVGVWTAFAALAPTGMRKLVLFPVAFGLGTGAIVAWAAREFHLEKRWAAVLTVPLVMAGLCLIASRGLSELRAEQAAIVAPAEQSMARAILEAAAQNDPTLAQELAAPDSTSVPSLSDYLAFRVRPLGEWSQPWPSVFWGAEILLASVAGAWTASRLPRRTQHSSEAT